MSKKFKYLLGLMGLLFLLSPEILLQVSIRGSNNEWSGRSDQKYKTLYHHFDVAKGFCGTVGLGKMKNALSIYKPTSDDYLVLAEAIEIVKNGEFKKELEYLVEAPPEAEYPFLTRLFYSYIVLRQ